MKHSIKKQMMAMFAGVLILMLLVLMAVNLWFLEPYYIREKKDSFLEFYDILYEAVESGNINKEENWKELVSLAEEENLFFMVVNPVMQSAYSNVPNTMELKRQLDEFLLDRTSKEDVVLKKTQDYEISMGERENGQPGDIRMRGRMGGEYIFVIRSPLAGIRESAAVSNRFLLYVGFGIIMVGSVLVWLFSKWMTRPILELTALSVKMTELDFDARYTGDVDNEIGILGKNFNLMSEKLKETIQDLKNANYHLQKDIEKREKAEQMRREFLGNVSHELKTPLALIQGYAEGLKEGISEDPESREFYCHVILDEAEKMNRLVKNLLTLNQLEYGEEEISFTRFDLTELIQGILANMQILFKEADVRVNFKQESPVYVWGDPYKIEQVVRNYMSNGFLHAKGEKVIEIKLKKTGEKIRTTVFNTGDPIPEEDLPRIWEKFYKVDKAHSREYGGNGIGLSIVKAIMDALKQDYGVNNYKNGVEFWFELDER